MSRKNALCIGGLSGATLSLLCIFAVGRSWRRDSIGQGLRPGWLRGAIRAAYVGSQLKEIDKTRASLIISYDLASDTDSDYPLANGPGMLILSRMKSGGSLSQEQPMRLSYPVFLPARQQARLSPEITEPFAWPMKEDLASLDKLRAFARRRLENVPEFVLFDEASHGQVELPERVGSASRPVEGGRSMSVPASRAAGELPDSPPNQEEPGTLNEWQQRKPWRE